MPVFLPSSLVNPIPCEKPLTHYPSTEQALIHGLAVSGFLVLVRATIIVARRVSLRATDG